MTEIFKGLISLLDVRQSMFFDELSEVIYNGMLPRSYRSSLADNWSTTPRANSGRERANLSILAKESLEKVATALQDEIAVRSVEIYEGSYNPKTDKEIEAGLLTERMLVDKAKLTELAKLTNRSMTDKLHIQFSFNGVTGLEQYKKIFNKCRTPLQIYYQFPSESKWHVGYMVYSDGKIYFCKSFFELSNDIFHYEEVYYTHSASLTLHDQVQPFISIQRETDKYPLKLATTFSTGETLSGLPSRHLSSSLEFLYYTLYFTATKFTIPEDADPFENCGLSRLTFTDIHLKYVSDSVQDKYKDFKMYLQVKCEPYVEYVKVYSSDDMKQKKHCVYMPINNWFRKIEVNLMAFKASPLAGGKSIHLGSFDLLNYDILSTSTSIVKKITEELTVDTSDKILRDAVIDYKAQNLSGYKSYLVNPNKNNFMEGKKMLKGDLSFAKNELKVSMFRLRRCANIVELWSEYVTEIFRFKYKKWTFFMIAIFHICLFFFNMNYLHMHLVQLMLVLIICSHRRSTQFIYEHVLHKLRMPEDLSPFYREPLMHTKTYLKAHRYLQIELLRKKLKPADSIVSDLKLIKLGFNSAPFILHEIVNLFEKVKNLASWYESRKTKALVAGLVVLMVVFYFVPLKLFVLAAFWGMVTKNKDYYEKHLARNKMITVHVLIQIVAKFIGFLSFTLDKYSGMNFETDFPFLKDEFEFSSFRKKLILRIEKHLDIEFPDNLLKAMTKMNDLVEILSSTNENLKIREAEELDIDPAMFEKKVMNPVAEKVVGFLNTTPTDFFDIIYNS